MCFLGGGEWVGAEISVTVRIVPINELCLAEKCFKEL